MFASSSDLSWLLFTLASFEGKLSNAGNEVIAASGYGPFVVRPMWTRSTGRLRQVTIERGASTESRPRL